jgi:hypothetical protein
VVFRVPAGALAQGGSSIVITKRFRGRITFVAAVIVLALALVPVALAGKPGGGGHTSGGSGGTCTHNAPGIAVQNNWTWGQTGSWGLPGQQLGFQVQVTNYDVGCSASSFDLAVSAPSGFSVSIPTTTINLNPSSSGYLWFYVVSPATVVGGDYPLTVTLERAGDPSPAASSVTYYKVYSSDTTAPTLFWSSPSNGAVLSGNSYTVSVSSSDDHAVKSLDLYIDGAHVSTTTCDEISYICDVSYKLSLSHMSGAHTATFTAHDWMGNVASLTASFTVS